MKKDESGRLRSLFSWFHLFRPGEIFKVLELSGVDKAISLHSYVTIYHSCLPFSSYPSCELHPWGLLLSAHPLSSSESAVLRALKICNTDKTYVHGFLLILINFNLIK